MKVNELMIGDYVLYQGNPNRVYRILPDTVPFADAGRMKEDLVHIVWNDVHDQVNVNNLEPIPITPEILEKNGFKFESPCINDNKDAWVYEWPNEKPNHVSHAFLLMSHHNKTEFPNFWIYAPNNPDIVYVHELQHALRLCGIEKEIKL